MSLLSYYELCDLVRADVITNVRPGAINGTSIDVHLGLEILVETVPSTLNPVDYSKREPVTMRPTTIPDDGYIVEPDEFFLAHTVEEFNLPADISAEYKLKSSMGRIGLEHMNAGWCDSWWHGSVLTLEFKNMLRYHSIKLRVGDPIGQVIFFRHERVPEDAGYAKRGRYNNDKFVSGIKK